MKHIAWLRRFVVIAVCLMAFGGCRGSVRHGDADLPNFQTVSSGLLRGGQPTREGFLRLAAMGVKTVVNVRGGDGDRPLLHGLELGYEQRPMSPWEPNDEDVLWFLAIATDPARVPVFLHCQHGADRTGYLVAMYRVMVEGWDRERAIQEMTAWGNGFHPFCRNLIEYVRDADAERLRNEIRHLRHD